MSFKPLSWRGRIVVSVCIVCLSLVVTLGNNFPWWFFPLFCAACIAGCRESFFGYNSHE